MITLACARSGACSKRRSRRLRAPPAVSLLDVVLLLVVLALLVVLVHALQS
jgi:hypothetical protein